MEARVGIWSLPKNAVVEFFVVTCISSFASITDQFPTANSATETVGGAESPDRVSRVMSVTSEPKVPHTPSAESPTKSREAPVSGHIASGKRLDFLITNYLLTVTGRDEC